MSEVITVTKWTNEKLQKLQDLRNQGLTVDEIADRLNIKIQTIRYAFKRLHKLGRENQFNSTKDTTKSVAKHSIIKQRTTSTAMITVQKGREMDEKFLLRAHGFDPNLWHITSITSNYWGSISDDYRQFHTKINVIPKNFEPENIAKTVNSKIESVYFPKSKLQRYGSDETLIIPLHDLNFGITTYSFISQYLLDIYDALARGYKKIIVLVSGDYFHSDFMNKTQTASNVQLNYVSNERAIREGTQFLRDLLRRCYDVTDNIDVYNVSGNHYGDKLYLWMKAMQEHYRGTPITFHVTMKPRVAFKLSNVGVMIQSDKVTKNNAPMLFATKFSDVWGSTRNHYIFSGHYHNKVTIDGDEVTEFRLGTPMPADSDERYNSYATTKRQLALFAFNPDHLTATYYIQH